MVMAHPWSTLGQASRRMGPNMTPVVILDRFGSEFAAAGVSGLWVTPDGIGKMPTFGGAYAPAARVGIELHGQFELGQVTTTPVEHASAIAGPLSQDESGICCTGQTSWPPHQRP